MDDVELQEGLQRSAQLELGKKPQFRDDLALAERLSFVSVPYNPRLHCNIDESAVRLAIPGSLLAHSKSHRRRRRPPPPAAALARTTLPRPRRSRGR